MNKMTEANTNGQLSETSFCRLCAQVNQNGSYIFSEGLDKNLGDLINKYLPLKVENDGKYPDKICPGCEIQLEATKLFFDLIIDGQNQLKAIYEGFKSDRIVQLEDLQNLSSKSGTLELHSVETGEKYFIQIMEDTLTEGPLYNADHGMLKDMNILKKEKKKRGRPRKQAMNELIEDDSTELEKKDDDNEKTNSNNDEVVDDGKRQRKIPARFAETVQGKELDDILRKEGIEEEDLGTDNPVKLDTEVIGRVEDQNGEKLEEPVIVTKVLQGNRLRRRTIPRKRKRKFRCDICLEEFKNFPRLRIHIQKIHTENEVGQAPSAPPEEKKENEENSNPMELNIDAANKCEKIHDENSFKCDLCDDIHKSESDLTDHLESKHEIEKKFKCPECSRCFSYAKTFEMHVEKHKMGVHFCEICQKKFNHASSLVYHRNAEHAGKRFVCNKCNKTFKHRQLLQRHQLVHSEERPYKCNMCPSAFKTRTNLVSHISIHKGDRNYVCSECGQSFIHKTSLNLHMRWHLGDKPFSCEVCQKSFSQKGNLGEHMRIHTGEKPFYCEVCGRSFTTSSQLKLHGRRHTGERPWKCEFCGRTFSHKDSWKEHCRRHVNDRPFKCELCNKTFTAMSCLKKHMRYHTGEKPHTCEICSKSFSDLSNLSKHRRIHESVLNANQNISLINTETDNLLYVYYETPKDGNMEVPLVDLEQTQSEVVISNDQDCLNFKENCMQIQQLIDQEGNPLSLNTQDGQQINVVTSITNGEQKFQGLLPDGTLVALDLQDSKVEPMKELIEHVEEDNSVSHLLLDGNMTFLSDNIDKTTSDLLVSDQSNICFVTYDPNTQNSV